MTQGTPVRSQLAQAAEGFKARTAERIADPDNLDATTFARFGVAERSALFKSNPTRYAELQAELDKAADVARMGGGR